MTTRHCRTCGTTVTVVDAFQDSVFENRHEQIVWVVLLDCGHEIVSKVTVGRYEDQR